jgi:tRNA threonylcarbamoyladenosine biosynthesis protein TsaE
MKRIITKNSKETRRVAASFASGLKGGEAVVLSGELGAGKTEFVKGMAKKLGVRDRISSPSFILMNQYNAYRRNSKIKKMAHIDCYRISSADDTLDLGLDEILADDKTVAVIEWGEKIKKILPKEKISVSIKYLEKENHREIILPGLP